MKIILLIISLIGFSSTTVILKEIPKNNYPIRMAYINRISNWYGDKIAASWGVPGYAQSHIYNYIALAFWTCDGGLKDMAAMWANAYNFF